MEIALIILATLQTIAVISWIAVFIWAVKLLTKDKAEPPKPHKPLFKPKEPKEPKETEEEKRLRILSENIENYDGSARNQVKI
jgi:hypothetical protein